VLVEPRRRTAEPVPPSPEVGRVAPPGLTRKQEILTGEPAARGPGRPEHMFGSRRARGSARPWSGARPQSTRPVGSGSKWVHVSACRCPQGAAPGPGSQGSAPFNAAHPLPIPTPPPPSLHPAFAPMRHPPKPLGPVPHPPPLRLCTPRARPSPLLTDGPPDQAPWTDAPLTQLPPRPYPDLTEPDPSCRLRRWATGPTTLDRRAIGTRGHRATEDQPAGRACNRGRGRRAAWAWLARRSSRTCDDRVTRARGRWCTTTAPAAINRPRRSTVAA
jgi:hypothetical protein